MPHLIGLQIHSAGATVATLRPDLTFAIHPIAQLEEVVRGATGQRGKWAVANADRESVGEGFVREVCVTLGGAMRGEPIVAGVAVPALWSERARAAFLRGMEGTPVKALRLVRDTTALAVGASLVDPTVEGLCALIHLGTHKLEFTIAELGGGRVKVLARQSARGLDGSNMNPSSLLALTTEVGKVVLAEAGVAASDLRRLIATGRRAYDRALVDTLSLRWGRRMEVFPAGTIAAGAGEVALGLSGMHKPWNLLDDLEDKLEARSSQAPSRLTPVPSPVPRFTPVPSPVPRLTPVPSPVPRLTPVPSPVPKYTPVPSPVPKYTPVPTMVSKTTSAPSPLPKLTPTPSSPSSEPPRRREASTRPPSDATLEIASSGSFKGLPTLEDVSALQLVAPAGPEAMQHPTVATLLNQFTFMREASGTLTLRRDRETVALAIDHGGVCLSSADHARAVAVFGWSGGTFTWQPGPHAWEVQRHRVAMTAFMSAGIRDRLRCFAVADFERHHLTRMSLAPSTLEAHRGRLSRLALPEVEERAIAYVLNGKKGFADVLAEAYLGRATMHRLVALLDLYGVLQWAPVPQAAGHDHVQEMTRLLAKIESANHFVALAVHWSAPADEIRQAWEAMATQYGTNGTHQRHAPALAARIYARASAAWEVLRHDATRVTHRREAYPGIDEELLAPLVESRAKALQMRGDHREAARMVALRGEFQVTPTLEVVTPRSKT